MIRFLFLFLFVNVDAGTVRLEFARKVCDFLGGSVADLETRERFNSANSFFTSTRRVFWTGGSFNGKIFVWSNGVPVMGPYCDELSIPQVRQQDYAVVFTRKGILPCLDFIFNYMPDGEVMCEKRPK